LSEGPESDLLQGGAALVLRTGHGTVRVTGTERASWLQGLLSNDIEALGPGQGCYAAWLTPQGRMLTDAVVLATEDALLVEVPSALFDTVVRQLDQSIFAEDVVLTDVSRTWATLGVHGAAAASVVQQVAGAALDGGRVSAVALDGWVEYQHGGDEAMRVVRTFAYGVSGYVLHVPADDVDLWLSRLRLAGATLVSTAALDFARIEAGRPEFLVDMDADTIPLEAGIEDRAISFTKGCYVGQEVIVRIVHRGGGRVVKKLVGLALDGDCVPAARAVVSAGRGEIGRVTSAAWSPRLRRSVALAYLHRDFIAPETSVRVSCDGADLAAAVRAFPLT